jgi:hypothetical protein
MSSLITVQVESDLYSVIQSFDALSEMWRVSAFMLDFPNFVLDISGKGFLSI